MAVEIHTTRFGSLYVEPSRLLCFPTGLPGIEDCREWTLLVTRTDRTLGWLQSTDAPDVALPVVNPQHFVPDYRLQISQRELAHIGLENRENLQFLGLQHLSLSLFFHESTLAIIQQIYLVSPV